jgi:hypothetical protein
MTIAQCDYCGTDYEQVRTSQKNCKTPRCLRDRHRDSMERHKGSTKRQPWRHHTRASNPIGLDSKGRGRD